MFNVVTLPHPEAEVWELQSWHTNRKSAEREARRMRGLGFAARVVADRAPSGCAWSDPGHDVLGDVVEAVRLMSGEQPAR